MDPASTFSAMPGAAAPAGLSDAWHWAMAPGFDFVAALSRDGTHAFQCFALRSYDESLVAAVMSFAREHESELIAPPDRPLVVAEGFSHPGYGFDTVVAFGPVLHRHHEEDDPALHQAIRVVQPAFRCEFAGDEPEEDARYRYVRAPGVPTTTLTRDPRPYLTMRHTSDTRVIPERFWASPDSLVIEFRRLEDRPDGFVEFENYRHEVRRVEWGAGRWGLTGDSTEPRRLEFGELLDLTRAALYGPNLDAAPARFPA